MRQSCFYCFKKEDTFHRTKRLPKVIFGFLFVVCCHILNSTRSRTTCLLRFTDEKELNPNPGRCEGRSPLGTSYIQTKQGFEVHAARPHMSFEVHGRERFNPIPGDLGRGVKTGKYQ